MNTDQPTNPHRGSDFNEFLIEQGLMPTPRTDAIAHRGLGSVAYIAEITGLARQLERELAAERALADRLAAVLQLYDADTLAGETMQWVPAHAEALAAWKEARK